MFIDHQLNRMIKLESTLVKLSSLLRIGNSGKHCDRLFLNVMLGLFRVLVGIIEEFEHSFDDGVQI